MVLSHLHEFHFVMDRRMKSDLMGLAPFTRHFCKNE